MTQEKYTTQNQEKCCFSII